MQYIAFDSHKRYTWARVETTEGQLVREEKVLHEPGALGRFLGGCEAGSPVALETGWSWYWIVDEIESAGCVPQLVHAGQAKKLMGLANKTDKLDARGLNVLQRTGALPTVWIAPGALRDQRELPRTRMVICQQRTRLKNRIHATLGKYGQSINEVSDVFGVAGRKLLGRRIRQLPEHAAYTTELVLSQLEEVERALKQIEKRMREVFGKFEAGKLLRTLPAIGPILSVVIVTEVGDVARFGSAERLASYSGTTPRVHQSGGRRRIGQLRTDVNHYLKWAYVEAANVVCLSRRSQPDRHVSRLYSRIQGRKGHAKAIGAVARHLAEATYWVLKKAEPYREPNSQDKVVSTRG